MNLALFKKYFEPEGLKPLFIFAGKRFINFNKEKFDFECIIIKNELNNLILCPDKSFLNIRIDQITAYIVCPLPAHILSLYFINKAFNQHIEVIAIADGIATGKPFKGFYSEGYKLLLLFRKYANQIYELPLKYYSDKYIAAKSQIYMGAANIFNHNRFVSSKSLFKEVNIQKYLNEFFEVDLKPYLNADVIFFTQPLSNNYWLILCDVLSIISKNGLRVLIKVHPAEDGNAYKVLEADNVVVANEKEVPAELIVNRLYNKLLISFYSSLMMQSDNPTNNNIWVYPLLSDENLNKRIKSEVDDNILIIKSLNELENEISKFKQKIDYHE
jgi:hypothetical protein